MNRLLYDKAVLPKRGTALSLNRINQRKHEISMIRKAKPSANINIHPRSKGNRPL